MTRKQDVVDLFRSCDIELDHHIDEYGDVINHSNIIFEFSRHLICQHVVKCDDHPDGDQECGRDKFIKYKITQALEYAYKACSASMINEGIIESSGMN